MAAAPLPARIIDKSLVSDRTCRLNIPARDCLGAVLPGLARTSIQRLAEFIPRSLGRPQPAASTAPPVKMRFA